MRESKITYVVLVNWNQFELTAACIRSLQETAAAQLRIVVVDNGSADDSAARLQATFGAQIDLLCQGSNLGFTGGNNAGIRFALEQEADYILLLNNDTIVAPGFLGPLVERAEAGPGVGPVTAKIYFMHDPTLLWAAGGRLNLLLGQAQNRGHGERDRGQYDHAEPVDYTTGCCLLARRAVFEKVGLLDDRYFTYFEDADWCLRAREAGYTCWYEPAAHLWHWAGAASKNAKTAPGGGTTNPRVYYYMTRNNIWLLRGHAAKAMLPLAAGIFFVRHMLVYTATFVALRRWPKLQAVWHGWQDGWQSR